MMWSFALSGLGILGMVLAGRKNLWGWAIGLIAQPLWVIYALVTGQHGFIAASLGYGCVYATNLHRWVREKREQRDRNAD